MCRSFQLFFTIFQADFSYTRLNQSLVHVSSSPINVADRVRSELHNRKNVQSQNKSIYIQASFLNYSQSKFVIAAIVAGVAFFSFLLQNRCKIECVNVPMCKCPSKIYNFDRSQPHKKTCTMNNLKITLYLKRKPFNEKYEKLCRNNY